MGERYRVIRRWYARDKGATTAHELLAFLQGESVSQESEGSRGLAPMATVFRDLVRENTHPLNVQEGVSDADAATYTVDRPPLFEVYMRMAEELAKRSTCARLQVGTVLTDPTLENVVAIGYNGNVRGFPQHLRLAGARTLWVHPFRDERAREGARGSSRTRWPS